MQHRAIIEVIDDDDGVRDAIVFQLQTAGYDARGYRSAEAFLNVLIEAESGCILTDVRMPGLTGLELVHDLKRRGATTPVIMMTGHGDIPLAVEAMRAGIADFIEKPLDDDILLQSIAKALSDRATARDNDHERGVCQARFALLSARERDVLDGVVLGRPNKVIAFDLGISPRTVEVYRAGLMTKTGASSLSDLIRMALRVAG